jgi:hypothetical protein
MEILSAFYGTDDKKIDVTDKIQKLCRNNNLVIRKSLHLNNLFCDPCFGTPKKLIITFYINKNVYRVVLDESYNHLTRDFDLSEVVEFVKTKEENEVFNIEI